MITTLDLADRLNIPHIDVMRAYETVIGCQFGLNLGTYVWEHEKDKTCYVLSRIHAFLVYCAIKLGTQEYTDFDFWCLHGQPHNAVVEIPDDVAERFWSGKRSQVC